MSRSAACSDMHLQARLLDVGVVHFLGELVSGRAGLPKTGVDFAEAECA